MNPNPEGGFQRYFGVYPAIVRDVVADELGRIELELPWLDGGESVSLRAALVTPYADDGQGWQIIPEAGSQVLVAFEAGDPRRGYVLGACWNGKAAMPDKPVQKANNRRLLVTRSGSRLEFDDGEPPKVTLQTKNGHTLTLDAGGDVVLTHSGGSTLTLKSSGQVEVRANSTLEVHASAVNVHAPSAQFDGTILCTSLTASVSVTSPLYSPGAGNVW